MDFTLSLRVFVLPFLFKWGKVCVFLFGFQFTKPHLKREELVPEDITKTYLYNFDPLKPHFYIVELGFTGVYIIFRISVQKHRLWVLVRTASPRRF